MNVLHKVPAGQALHSIAYPSIQSEFEVQAYLYGALKAQGLDVRGEVCVFGLFGMREAKAVCRFDLVVFENKNPILILEVKARHVTHKNGIEANRQFKRYTTFGLPVWFVYGMDGAEIALSELKNGVHPEPGAQETRAARA